MVVSVDEVLNELGWKDGFRIPVANEENKRLEIEVSTDKRTRLYIEFIDISLTANFPDFLLTDRG